MLTITIKNQSKVYQFTQILQNLKGISNELNLICKEDGLYAQGMTQVIFVYLRWI